MLYLTVVTILFTLSLCATEYLRLRTTDPGTNTVSGYLTGKAATVEDAGFGVMALALFVFAWQLHAWASIPIALVGIGLIGAMVSDRFPALFHGQKERWHLGFTGLIFVAALAMELLLDQSGYAFAFTGATVAVSAVSWLLIRAPTAQQAVTEKLAVLLIIIWVLAFSVGAR